MVSRQDADGTRISLSDWGELALTERTPARTSVTPVAREALPELLAARFALGGFALGAGGRLVLEGQLTLSVEGEEHGLSQGELVRVAPSVRRQLINAGSERLALLALGGSGEHAGRDGRAWESWEEDGDGRPPSEIPLPEDLP